MKRSVSINSRWVNFWSTWWSIIVGFLWSFFFQFHFFMTFFSTREIWLFSVVIPLPKNTRKKWREFRLKFENGKIREAQGQCARQDQVRPCYLFQTTFSNLFNLSSAICYNQNGIVPWPICTVFFFNPLF